MHYIQNFSIEEIEVIRKLDRYFTSDMDFREKVFHALLIAQHDLEAHHYSSEHEKAKICTFHDILLNLLHKLNPK